MFICTRYRMWQRKKFQLERRRLIYSVVGKHGNTETKLIYISGHGPTHATSHAVGKAMAGIRVIADGK